MWDGWNSGETGETVGRLRDNGASRKQPGFSGTQRGRLGEFAGGDEVLEQTKCRRARIGARCG